MVELLPQDVPIVLLVLDAHVLPVPGVDDSQVVKETRVRAAAIYILSWHNLKFNFLPLGWKGKTWTDVMCLIVGLRHHEVFPHNIQVSTKTT